MTTQPAPSADPLARFRDDPQIWPVLQERATALAQADSATDVEQGDEIMTFRLGDASYGVPAEFVREVQPLGSYTRLPSAPPFVIGLVNVRGRLLTALDIRPLLEMSAPTPSEGAFLLIVAVGGAEVGLLADGAIEVHRSERDLTPTPSAAAGRGVGWIRGVDQDMTLRLDPTLLLRDPRLIVNDETE